jgi:hypothetical protein
MVYRSSPASPVKQFVRMSFRRPRFVHRPILRVSVRPFLRAVRHAVLVWQHLVTLRVLKHSGRISLRIALPTRLSRLLVQPLVPGRQAPRQPVLRAFLRRRLQVKRQLKLPSRMPLASSLDTFSWEYLQFWWDVWFSEIHNKCFQTSTCNSCHSYSYHN